MNITTHNGVYHADEVFAVATLQLLNRLQNNCEVDAFILNRTRDPVAIKNAREKGHYIIDVGGVYDENSNQFDHHQYKAEDRLFRSENSFPYASAGMVWKKFGIQIVMSVRDGQFIGLPKQDVPACTLEEATEVARLVDEKLIKFIDSIDNGVDCKETCYINRFLADLFQVGGEASFISAVIWALNILEITIKSNLLQIREKAEYEKALEGAGDKDVVIFEKGFKNAAIDISERFEKPKFIIYPAVGSTDWNIQSVPAKGEPLSKRISFPAEYAGLRDSKLAEVSGITDAVFCHAGQWLFVTRTKESAIQLAEKLCAQ